MRTVIFDLDGTLADTSGDLLAAANVCFRELGHGDVLTTATDRGTAVRGARAMLTEGFERLGQPFVQSDIDQQFPILLEAYGKDIATHTTIYPGAREAVSRLRDAGYKVGICTNKPEGLAEQLMAALDFRDAFHSLVGADTLTVRKPDPLPFVEAVTRAGGDPARAVLVGDTQTDRDTSANAGAPSILVTFGPGSFDVSSLKPEALLDHFDDLDGIVARLIA
ncbi:phosphoglycolate phosphatase [Litoreibacter halocynthiae]|uniref:phosphoglycolate phosphatase n=1 Tax=Litoreibacter halocynthiae TaxID=1242689 RepID=A0A4R7LGV0_9RHOB|nr:HAD-IA family hydrolase [Litoreibacter halocynthiae]TDT74967.1 phosphoglycolate phosphatase [Litoreibacter halocynthiae]